MRTLKPLITFILLAIWSLPALATKISGKVVDDKQAPMPFLTVFVKGSTIGTTTNSEGEYFLDLEPGDYQLVFRFVGYKTVVKTIQVGNAPITLNVVMQQEALQLEGVEISAEAENPAYEMIRQAQQKRKYYLNELKEYSCKVYIKGLQRITKAPKTILGVDITIPGAEDDSTNSGIVYLSESVSDFSYQVPNKKKERMISSKTSGRNNAFSWNSALDFDLNFYRANIEMGPLSERNFISPIAPTAMLYYDYEFKGDFKDGNVLVNKIKVIPKRKGLPAFSGYMYLQDSSWRIHSTELKVSKSLGNVNYVDSLLVKQVYLPVTQDQKLWVMGTQTFEYFFDFPLFKVKGDGYYIGIFSDYNVNPKFEENYFGAEISRIEDGANKKDSSYWDAARPIKLTEIEKEDYYKKDSIAIAHESKSYLDSMDRIRNKFKPINAITGYTYRNSYKKVNFSFPSLLENFQFNTIEGYNINLGIKASKFNQEKNKYISFNQQFRYGFSSNKLYYKSIFYRRFNGINRRRIQVEAGKYVEQLNANRPITPFINTLYTLLRERNYMKLFEKTYARFAYGQELFNGLFIVSSLEYAHRTPLANTVTNQGIDRDGIAFTSNNPLTPNDNTLIFEEHQAFMFDIRARIRFKQQYYLRPNLKYASKSDYPTIYLYYQKAIKGIAGSDTDFDFFKVSVEDDVKLGLFGRSEFNVAYGGFLSDKTVPFVDYKHFMTTQTLFSNNLLPAFFNLSYYAQSTLDNFFEGHYEHHFNGFFFQKLPLFRKLKWQVVAGSHLLYTDSFKDYLELTIGVENIFRVGRFDVVFSRLHGENFQTNLRLRVGF
ncbi:MAG: DUF5686 and carboxypeptidase regulatory-like domain-containing protein [Flammeovirgaceae bacterium]